MSSILDKLNSKYQTEVKFRDGSMILFHDESIGDKEIGFLEELTKEQFRKIMLREFNFTVHKMGNA